MEVHYLEENHQKKFAMLPYRDFLHLLELVTEEKDYQLAPLTGRFDCKNRLHNF